MRWTDTATTTDTETGRIKEASQCWRQGAKCQFCAGTGSAAAGNVHVMAFLACTNVFA